MKLQSRWAGSAFWAAAFVLAVLAGVAGAAWGQSQAPVFTDDKGHQVAASSASHLLYAVFGGVLFACAVFAVFAVVWLLTWARRRRREGPSPQDRLDEDAMSVADVEGLFDTDDRRGEG